MNRKSLALNSILLAIVASSQIPGIQASAKVVTVTASGYLAGVNNIDNAFDETVHAGTAFNYTFSYDDTLLPAYQDSTQGVYAFYGNARNLGATITFGDYTLTPSVNDFNEINPINNESDGARFKDLILITNGSDTITTPATSTNTFHGVATTLLELGDSSATALSSTNLPPLNAYDPAKWNPFGVVGSSFFSLGFSTTDNGTSASFSGNIVHLSATTAVPEPSPLAVLVLGCGVMTILGFSVRKRTRMNINS
ncbi:MAG: hypothetical protein JWQ02_3993 [Capsulimonas sp.]|nr:hypothetical protein [Capsulimonas sp.]